MKLRFIRFILNLLNIVLKGNKPFLCFNYPSVQIIGLGGTGEAFEEANTMLVFIWTLLARSLGRHRPPLRGWIYTLFVYTSFRGSFWTQDIRDDRFYKLFNFHVNIVISISGWITGVWEYWNPEEKLSIFHAYMYLSRLKIEEFYSNKQNNDKSRHNLVNFHENFQRYFLEFFNWIRQFNRVQYLKNKRHFNQQKAFRSFNYRKSNIIYF